MMIASLKTMAKMFAKIAKMFDKLLATIIAIRRRLALILHLEAKYAKMDCKNEIYTKNWIRKIWTIKVNFGEKSMAKVNLRLKSTIWSTCVNGLVNDDVS